jgi:pimeloyl-ACP methyl ester carboxylesterase
MARRRPNTWLQTLPGGHVVHFDNPVVFTEVLRNFLEGLKERLVATVD